MIVYANGKVLATDQDGNTTPISSVNPAKNELRVADEESRDLLYKILVQLKLMNIHLNNMTDSFLTEEDIS